MAVITANGVALPDPISLSVDDEIIWSEDTGRTLSGLMVGDVIAKKKKISIKWHILTDSQMATINNALTAGFFNVSFHDNGADHSITVYRGTISKEQIGQSLYKNISVDLVQR